jgi:hypothetical protein
MIPSMNPSDPPPFYQLDSMAFQELCRDLLELEPGIGVCEVYGTPGQGQHGVDLKAVARDVYANEVGQCKCYKNFPPDLIREASEEFLKHLDFWQERKVRRFILFVGSALDRRQQQDEIDQQIKRFDALGIRYEAWSARTLRTKLRHHPEIVWRYTKSQEWVENICGRIFDPTPVGIDRSSGIIASLLNSQAQLSGGLSKELGRRIDEIREFYYQGRIHKAYELIDELHHDANWEFLEKPLQARILRLKAGYTLELKSDLAEAKSLVEEASALDPDGDDSGTRAIISYYDQGVEAALAVVDRPSTLHGFNLKVGLLLQAERIDEALAALNDPPKAISIDAETRRLHALALLAGGDVEGARKLIGQVLEEHPRRESTRFVSAMVDYFSCLSRVALPPRVVVWPQPENSQLVKKDDQSLGLMRQAAAEFESLARGSERGDDQRRILETWHLASLAIDPTRQAEAAEFCRSLLEREPTHHRALAWALAHNFEVDVTASERPLEDSVALGKSVHDAQTLEQVLVLTGLYVRLGKADRARDLLKLWEGEFKAAGVENVWRFWEGQVLANSDPEEALAFARDERDPSLRRGLMLSALRSQALRSGDWRPHIRYLEKSFRRTKSGEYLLELCWIKAQQEDWPYVADRAEALVESVMTADAVRLAAGGVWNTRSPKKCLRLLNKYERLFPGGALPGDLWRARVECEIKTGSPQAVADAQELVHKDQAAENILTLVHAHVRGADLKGAVVAARPLLQRHHDVPAVELIRVAKWIRLEDTSLARELLRQAIPRVSDDPATIGHALQVGFSLGLDNEIGRLMRRAQEFSTQGKGPLTHKTLNEAAAIRRQQLEHLQDAYRCYERGEIPAHYLSDVSKVPLVDYLHGIPRQNREQANPLSQPRVFIRHGGRPFEEARVNESECWRLHLDVSALILARSLGVLDRVEKCFAPLHVPSSLLSDLVSQRDALSHPQPLRIISYGKILDLLRDGGLNAFPQFTDVSDSPGAVAPAGFDTDSDVAEKMGREWVALLSHARAENGFIVDFLPLKSRTPLREPVSLPELWGKHVTNCHAVALGLRNSSGLPEPQYKEALDALGSEGVAVEPLMVPPAGSKLFLRRGIASVLARAGLLDGVCQSFDVYADPAEVAEARQEVKENNRLTELNTWLADLAEHARNRIEDGTYQPIVLSDEQLQTRLKDEEELDAPSTSLADLLLFDYGEGDVLWIDDRYVNGFARRETVPIIGISEVLGALRARGELSEQEYYHQVVTLRASNYRYVPPDSGEIIYQLEKAEVTEDGDVGETWELSVIRRYLSACLLDNDRLQRPPLPADSPNPAGELSFVFGVMRAAEAAMIEAWADETIGVEVAEARADWIFNNLYTGGIGIRHLLPNSEARADAIDLLGLSVAGTLTQAAMRIGSFKEPHSERRKKFISWFENRAFFRRLRTDPAVKAAAVRSLERIIGEAAAGAYSGGEPLQEMGVRVRMSQLYSDLPDELTDAMNLPPEVVDWVGVMTIRAARVGHMHFEITDYTEAVGRVMADGAAEITAQDGGAEDRYTFKRASLAGVERDRSPVIEIFDRGGKLVGRVSDPLLWLLSPDPAEVEEVLKRHRFWFDCEQSLLEQEIGEIVGTDDPRARADRVKKWWGESAEVFYRELEGQLVSTREFLWAGLTPASADGLRRHFRLPPALAEGTSLVDALRQSAATLLREDGVKATLDRLARLPCRIPEEAVAELSELPAGERNKLFMEWAGAWVSPVSRLHLVDLVLRTSPGDEAAIQTARGALADLFDDESGGTAFRLFDALLDFVNKEFGYWAETAGWPTPVKLALMWAHACKLHNVFHASGAEPVALAKTFRAENRHLSTDVLTRDPAYWSDVLHPRRLNRAFFLTHGVARVVEGNSREALETVGAPELVRVRALRNAGDIPIPVAEYFHDTTLATNVAGSFLGGDRGEALKPYLEEDVAQILASDHMEELVRGAIENLENDPTQHSWVTIRAIVGDLPLYARLRDRFAALLATLNVEEVLKADPVVACQALRAAADQMWNFSDDSLRERCEAALLSLAAFQARGSLKSGLVVGGQHDGPDETVIGELIEIALRLAVRPNDPRSTSRAFARLLEGMVKAWPALGANVGYAVSKLTSELPAHQLHGMWPLLLYLRASQSQPL